MKQLRLTRVQVLAAGASVAVGIIVLFMFLFIRPLRAEISTIEENAGAQESKAAERPRVEKELAAAQEQEARVTAEYDEIMETRMPDVSLADPVVAMMRLWQLPREEGELIQSWFATSGAAVSGYGFPAFGTTLPNQSMRMLPPLDWGLQVEVKDFPSLLKWLETVPKAPRFMVVRSVSILGPRRPGEPLLADVPVTLYLWTKDSKRVAVAAAAGVPGPAVGRGAGIGAGPRGGRRRERGMPGEL